MHLSTQFTSGSNPYLFQYVIFLLLAQTWSKSVMNVRLDDFDTSPMNNTLTLCSTVYILA